MEPQPKSKELDLSPTFIIPSLRVVNEEQFSTVNKGVTAVSKDIKSGNYKPTVRGWSLKSSGSIDFTNNVGTIAGTLAAGDHTHTGVYVPTANFKTVVKTSDETVNNSNTLQSDDQLLFAVGANETWAAEFVIFFDTGTTPNIKFCWSVPASTTALWSFMETDSNVTKNVSTSIYRPGGGAGFTRACHIKAVFWSSSTTGNITLTWAQNTADASDTKVLTGSYLIATKLA